MTQNVDAIYDNGVLRPLEPLAMANGTRVHLRVEQEERAEQDAEKARAQFERCFGSVDLGRPIGVCNEDIDADLARQLGGADGIR